MTFETPDQSPIQRYDFDALILLQKYHTGLDTPGSILRPFGMPYFSDWYMTIFLGNYSDFSIMLSALSVDEQKNKFQQREGLVQLCAIFLPIIGAKFFHQKGNPAHPSFPQKGIKTPREVEYRYFISLLVFPVLFVSK